MYILSFLNQAYEHVFVREVAGQLTGTNNRSLAKSFTAKTDKLALAKAKKFLDSRSELAFLKVKLYKYDPNLTNLKNDLNNLKLN